jgi:hypothetical protein
MTSDLRGDHDIPDIEASNPTPSSSQASKTPSAQHFTRGGAATPKSVRNARDPIRISGVRFCRGSPAEIEHGLKGYISCVLNGAIGIDGLTLRRTQAGSLSISFPSRRDSRGRRHHSVWPKDRRAHYEIEQQILADLRRQCVLE